MKKTNKTSSVPYKETCRCLALKLDKAALKLHQEVEGSNVGDDSFNHYVPPKNWEEAKRRVDFVYAMLDEYHKFLYSMQPLSYFIGYLHRKINELNSRIEERSAQISFEFLGDSDLETMQKDLSKFQEMKRICQNPDAYFEAPQYLNGS